MKKTRYKIVLTIAGSDTIAGAGIQADLKTFSALGCYGLSVVTALTAQNTMGVASVHPVPFNFVRDQMDAVLSDIKPDAVKIGMLYSAAVIQTVAEQLEKYAVKNIVLDTVMASQRGECLMEEDAVRVLKDFLIPASAIITPNLPEASVMVGRPVDNLQDMRNAALRLSTSGARAVLIKGGHLKGDDIKDLLYISSEDRFKVFESKRIATSNDHGTGCTLSSAIAAFLARGHGLEDSVGFARRYLKGAILAGAGYEIGKGRGPLHHFYDLW
ncbi:Hydroxymethylpyrimidine/phosphomethylpyrimidine kinase [uncultured Desulfobacterium sp.]|uniref:hydroxymethylpyrimidine kinase n=1 Tax=uncultured Desulfobacterium sp. TaxID=201089 RepID=A0A445N241_9BACT|nr:Hydroxymethylpyrimidine/phosphomethylpyrimidine kinase [uncultured Desulfobacterium sp.]